MFKNILHAIGNTPLVKVNFASPAQIYAKLEYLNPGGSVKDRSALFMIETAEREGRLQPGGTIIDASSGNHGIAVAMIGRLKGYRVIITVSEKISQEKLKTIQAYGAEVIMCPAVAFIDDPRSYHSVAVKLHRETPNSFMPNQYFNIVNAQAHFSLLGPEIWRQTNGTITHFFAGAGTGGTVSGVGKFLKSQNPQVKITAIDSINSFRSTNGQPKPYAIEGIGIDFETPVLNQAILDAIYPVSDAQAVNMLQELAAQHGLLVGPSSGAVAYAVQQVAKDLTANDVVVFICGDSGRAYLSKDFYQPSVDNQPVTTTTQQPGLQHLLQSSQH
ncbi:MAG TPA: cysteine synthase family protein [Candidatus Babeliales bacterium]|nr:cysteine synthase family protein [Candidatus Babeliales bacterium]